MKKITVLNFCSTMVLWLATWPYYWTLCHHTITPIRRISRCTGDMKPLRHALQLFRRHKDEELRFVMTASTLSAAANLASLQWPTSPDSPWAARALWYCSLLLSIFSLILAAQQAALLKLLPLPETSILRCVGCRDHERQDATLPTLPRPLVDKNEARELGKTLRLFVRRHQASSGSATNAVYPAGHASPGTAATAVTGNPNNTFHQAAVIEAQHAILDTKCESMPIKVSADSRTTTLGTPVTSNREGSNFPYSPSHSGVPDWNMIYIWQAPMMLMSWSWVQYILGITLWVASPALWPRIRYEDDEKVALFYTVSCAVSCLNFGWCSVWAYRAAAPAHSYLLDDTEFPEEETITSL